MTVAERPDVAAALRQLQAGPWLERWRRDQFGIFWRRGSHKWADANEYNARQPVPLVDATLTRAERTALIEAGHITNRITDRGVEWSIPRRREIAARMAA